MTTDWPAATARLLATAARTLLGTGALIGATCGKDAMALAQRYFDGSAVP